MPSKFVRSGRTREESFPAEDDLHYHEDKQGVLHACYHGTKNLITDYKFWLGMTLGFPFEHFLYEKVWPFTLVTHLIDRF